MVQLNTIAFQSCLFVLAIMQCATSSPTLRGLDESEFRQLASGGRLPPKLDSVLCNGGVMVDLGAGLECIHRIEPPPLDIFFKSEPDQTSSTSLLMSVNPIPKIPLPKNVADKLKLTLNFGISFIPGGNFINFFVNILWPGTEEMSVWDQVKDQVEHLVDSAILNKEVENMQDNLIGLSAVLSHYASARGSEKANYLITLLSILNQVRASIANSPNKLHLLPIAQVTAVMHVGLLRERMDQGEELFHYNSTVWESDLRDTVASYSTFMKDSAAEWIAWRPTTIHAREWETGFILYTQHGEITDDVTKEHIYYEEGTNSISGYYSETVKGAELRMNNQAKLELARAIEPAFFLQRLLPGNSNAPADVFPGFMLLEAGPYTPSTLGLTPLSTKNTNGGVTDSEGGISALAGTSASKCYTDQGTSPCVSSLQFSHGQGGVGNKIGNENIQETSSFTYEVPTGSRIYGVKALMDTKSIRGIQLLQYNNNFENAAVTSPDFGQKTFQANIDAVASFGYELVSVQYAKNPAVSERGLTAISFKYKFVDL